MEAANPKAWSCEKKYLFVIGKQSGKRERKAVFRDLKLMDQCVLQH